MTDDDNIPLENSFLELIHWKTLEEWNERETIQARKIYSTFDEAAKAIDEQGPFEVETDRVNAYFIRTSGRFENDIIAIRQSGLNVRRILIRKDTFPELFGSFQRCVNSVLSNNAIGPEVELAHLQDYAKRREISAHDVEDSRRYDRAEIDATALLQIVALRDSIIDELSSEGQPRWRSVKPGCGQKSSGF